MKRFMPIIQFQSSVSVGCKRRFYALFPLPLASETSLELRYLKDEQPETSVIHCMVYCVLIVDSLCQAGLSDSSCFPNNRRLVFLTVMSFSSEVYGYQEYTRALSTKTLVKVDNILAKDSSGTREIFVGLPSNKSFNLLIKIISFRI